MRPSGLRDTLNEIRFSYPLMVLKADFGQELQNPIWLMRAYDA